ncbi:MAG: methyl-accepting chemotaxis protein [Vallitalea sp.]|jgi:methyl-accepting chemotaxis protein|nr:methyl-accepting chemotaxis protein [Vallitalea sp.]
MFKNLKIKAKLGILSTILTLFIIIIGSVGFLNLTKANKDITTMYYDRLLAIEQLNDSRAHARAIEADIYSIMMNIHDPEYQQYKLKDIETRVQKFNENFINYKKTKLDQFEVDTIKLLEDNLLLYRDGRQKVIDLALNGNYAEAYNAYDKIEKTAEAFQQNLIDLASYNVTVGDELNRQNKIEYGRSVKIYISLLIVSIIISIALSIYISKAISTPIGLSINHMRKIANYDISQDIPSAFLNRKDEIGGLATMIQEIQKRLRELLRNIEETSEQIASSSEELTATSQQSAHAAEEVVRAIDDMSRGAAEQAESTEEGSEKLSNLGNLIEKERNNMDVLNETSNIVHQLVSEGLTILDKLANKTKKSSDATTNVYESIKKTNESSKKISEASNLIASIAEQTNLLALNAAIEAARAGEHGKGFAVVADEIRQLAEQSTESTKIIDNMVKSLQYDSKKAVDIMESVSEIIKEQMENMNETESKFNEMSEAINKSAKAVEIITESGIQMEQKKNEVLETVQLLSAVAEENAAGTEHSSASMAEQSASIKEIANSSESLSVLSQELQGLISKFQI